MSILKSDFEEIIDKLIDYHAGCESDEDAENTIEAINALQKIIDRGKMSTLKPYAKCGANLDLRWIKSMSVEEVKHEILEYLADADKCISEDGEYIRGWKSALLVALELLEKIQ